MSTMNSERLPMAVAPRAPPSTTMVEMAARIVGYDRDYEQCVKD